MYIFYQFILGYLAVIGFAYYLTVPFKVIPYCAIGGAVGWTTFMYFSKYLNNGFLGILLGSILIGLLGEILSRKFKMPATVFTIAGIVPLVPGLNLYYMMYNIVMSNYSEAFTEGLNASIIAGSISIGLFLASSISNRVIKHMYKKRSGVL